jgi:hypothetical protein
MATVAKPLRVVFRTPLTSGRTCGTSCRMIRPLGSVCVRPFMWTPLMRTQFVRTACPGSWILSPSCRAVPGPGVMLCAPLLPPLFSWLELLSRTTLCMRARVRSLRGSCLGVCLLLRCHLCLALLGVAPFCSAPLGVLRPKPRWGRAWSPIWGFFFFNIAVLMTLNMCVRCLCWRSCSSGEYNFAMVTYVQQRTVTREATMQFFIQRTLNESCANILAPQFSKKREKNQIGDHKYYVKWGAVQGRPPKGTP